MSFVTVVNTKDMGKKDYVEVQYKIDHARQIDDLKVPDFSDFTVVQGPSESMGTSIINGAVSQSRSVTYVLQPKHPGKCTVPGAQAVVDGTNVRSNAVVVNVRNVDNYGTAQPLNNFSPLPDTGWPSAEPEVDIEETLRPGEDINEKIRKNFFIRVALSKQDCYVGEPIVVTYKLYSRLHSDSRVLKHPSLNGFSVYDMMDPGDDRTSVEKVNGKNFRVHIIRKAQLIPLQAGDISLDPVEIDNTIYFLKTEKGQPSGGGLGSLLDRFFDSGYGGTPISQHLVLDSKPVSVHVKPLPVVKRPPDFTGAVGKFSIQASVDSKSIDTGDAAMLKVTVKGNGNLPMINAPTVDWPAEMESYDVSSKENIDKSVAPLGGSKIFSYSFTCTKTGKYSLPPIRFNYFDPVADTYKIIQTEPIAIQFNHARKRKTSPDTMVAASPSTNGWVRRAIWITGGILIGGLGIFLLMQRKQPTSKGDRVKIEPAPPVAPVPPPVDPLKESRDFLSAGEYGKCYAAVNRAIWKAVSEKIQLPASELTKLNIAGGLRSMGWGDIEIMRLTNLLNECEMKLYTPQYSSEDAERVIGEADVVIRKLEDRIDDR